MSVTVNITAASKWFAGEDKILEFEPLVDDGKALDDTTKGVEDYTGKVLVWWLAKSVGPSATALVEKRTGAGINLTGIYNANRATNSQRVRVIVDDVDTDALKAGTYYHALKQLIASADSILTDGTVALLRAAAPAE